MVNYLKNIDYIKSVNRVVANEQKPNGTDYDKKSVNKEYLVDTIFNDISYFFFNSTNMSKKNNNKRFWNIH